MTAALLQLKTVTCSAIAVGRRIHQDLIDVSAFVSDGCTGAPDFFFFDCCENHDFGYEFGADMGSTRLKEDNDLFLCMKRKLKKQNKNKGWMWLLPYAYWLGVRVLGWTRYTGKQRNG